MIIYNRDRFLNEAIESVLQQTYPDWELILWNNGSIDHSLEIAEQYAKQDARLRVFSGPHQSLTAALKAAHCHVKGKYLGWVDSDDRLAPSALAETVSILDATPSIGMVYTDYHVMNEQGQIIRLGHRCKIPYSKERLLVDFMTFHFRLIRRSKFDEAGGIDEAIDLVQDYDLCLRLSEITEVYHLVKPLYDYRVHLSSTSQQSRIDNIFATQDAITRALIRRKLSEQYEIDMEITAQYILRPKRSYIHRNKDNQK